MRAYVAGPMRGIKDWNYPLFDRVAKRLRTDGWQVVTPAEIDRAFGLDEHKYPELPHWWSMSATLAIDFIVISTCESIVLLNRWEQSEGVAAELQQAQSLGLKVFEYHIGSGPTRREDLERRVEARG